MNLLSLFITFAKVGVMTFGGGYTMIPILEREVVQNKGWISSEELMDYYAVGQCTPGVIAVNTGIFIGYKTAGIPGGIAAALGVITPSVIIITIIASFLSNFADIPAVKSAFAAVRACVCVLIFNSVLKLWKNAVRDLPALILLLLVLAGSLFLDISPVVFVTACAVCGLLLTRLGVRKQ